MKCRECEVEDIDEKFVETTLCLPCARAERARRVINTMLGIDDAELIIDFVAQALIYCDMSRGEYGKLVKDNAVYIVEKQPVFLNKSIWDHLQNFDVINGDKVELEVCDDCGHRVDLHGINGCSFECNKGEKWQDRMCGCTQTKEG